MEVTGTTLGSPGGTQVVTLGGRASEAEPSLQSWLQFYDGCLSLTRFLDEFPGKNYGNGMLCENKVLFFLYLTFQESLLPAPSTQTPPLPEPKFVLKGRISHQLPSAYLLLFSI